jgi:hypothetical protein
MPAGGIAVPERNSNSVETAIESVVVETCCEQTAVHYPENFVDAVAEDEATVLDGYSCLLPREKAAAHIDYVFGIHSARRDWFRGRCDLPSATVSPSWFPMQCIHTRLFQISV